MSMPDIATAVPLQRYQLCDFSLVVLGDIESRDGVKYRYLMGIIPQGEAQPQLFISVEDIKGGQQMRILAAQNSQTLQGGGPWHDVDSFAQDAIAISAKLLNINLQEYEPFQIQ